MSFQQIEDLKSAFMKAFHHRHPSIKEVKKFFEHLTREERDIVLTKVCPQSSPAIINSFGVLHHFVSREFDTDSIEYIISLGADLEQVCSKLNYEVESGIFIKRTALMEACVQGKIRHVKCLVDAGADVNHSCDGISPLSCACEKKNESIVRFLLSRGAEINKVLTDSMTVVHVSCKCGVSGLIMQLLLDGGADITARDDNNQTPLDIAIDNANCEIVELFVSVLHLTDYEVFRTWALLGCKLFTIDSGPEHQVLYWKRILMQEPDASNHRLYSSLSALLQFSLNDGDLTNNCPDGQCVHFCSSLHEQFLCLIEEKLDSSQKKLSFLKIIADVKVTTEDGTQSQDEMFGYETCLFFNYLLSYLLLGSTNISTTNAWIEAVSAFIYRDDWYIALQFIEFHKSNLNDPQYISNAHKQLTLCLHSLCSYFMDIYFSQVDTSEIEHEKDKLHDIICWLLFFARTLFHYTLSTSVDYHRSTGYYSVSGPILQFLKETKVACQDIAVITKLILSVNINTDCKEIIAVLKTCEEFGDLGNLFQNFILTVAVKGLPYSHVYDHHPFHSQDVFPCQKTTDFLLSVGFNVDSRDLNGNTPLYNAIKSCIEDVGCIHALLKGGANIVLTNKQDESPFQVLVSRSDLDINVFKYMTLKSLAVLCVLKNNIPYYKSTVPKPLQKYIKSQECPKFTFVSMVDG